MNKVRRILLAVLRISVAIGLLVYLSVSGAINWTGLMGLMIAWPVTVMALLLYLSIVVVLAWRLCLLMKPYGLNLTLFRSIKLCLIGTFFNTCLPGSSSGDIVKIYYATAGNRGRRVEVATIMLLDRAVGMFAMLLLPLLVAPFFWQLIMSSPTLRGLLWAAAAVAVAMMMGMIVGSSNRLRDGRLLRWAFNRLPLGRHAARVLDTVREYRSHVGTLIVVVGLSLLAHAMTVGVILLIAQATNPGRLAGETSFLVPLGFLANSLPLTPGGLGVGEAAFNKLFALAGIAGGAELLLGWRLLTILVGLGGLILYLDGRKHFVLESFPQTANELSFRQTPASVAMPNSCAGGEVT